MKRKKAAPTAAAHSPGSSTTHFAGAVIAVAVVCYTFLRGDADNLEPTKAAPAVTGYDFSDPKADHSAAASRFGARGDELNQLKAFQAAVKHKPNRAGYWMDVGVSYMRAQRLDESEHAYKTAYKLRPKLPLLEENMQALKQWQDHAAKTRGGHSNSGKQKNTKKESKYQGTGSSTKQKSKYQRPKSSKYKRVGHQATKHDEFNDPATDYNQMGMVLDAAGDKERSIKAFEANAKFNGGAEAYMNLGVACMRSARLAEAEAHMYKVSMIDAISVQEACCNKFLLALPAIRH